MFPVYMNTVEINFKRILTPNIHPNPSDDWDLDFQEPVNKKRFEGPFVFQAQFNASRARTWQQRTVSATGDESETRLHLVYSAADYPSTIPKIKKGDLVTKIGGEIVDYLVSEVRPESALRSAGSNALLMYVELIENSNQR